MLPQIYTRDPRPIPLCVMASSAMGLNLGIFWLLPITHAKQMRSRTGGLRMFVFTHRPQYMQVTQAPDEPRLFWLREKPKGPQVMPHAGIKMAQVLWSQVFICECCFHTSLLLDASPLLSVKAACSFIVGALCTAARIFAPEMNENSTLCDPLLDVSKAKKLSISWKDAACSLVIPERQCQVTLAQLYNVTIKNEKVTSIKLVWKQHRDPEVGVPLDIVRDMFLTKYTCKAACV